MLCNRFYFGLYFFFVSLSTPELPWQTIERRYSETLANIKKPQKWHYWNLQFSKNSNYMPIWLSSLQPLLRLPWLATKFKLAWKLRAFDRLRLSNRMFCWNTSQMIRIYCIPFMPKLVHFYYDDSSPNLVKFQKENHFGIDQAQHLNQNSKHPS